MLALGFGSFVFWALRCKTRWLLISSVAIGYAGLTRPTYQALAFALAGNLLVMSIMFCWSPAIRKDMRKASLILICSSVILIGSYAFLNYLKFDHFGLGLITPVDSGTLSTRTARVIERLPDEYTGIREVLIKARDADLIALGGMHTGHGYISNPNVIQELTNVTGLQGPQLAKYLLRINLLLIRKAPLEYLYDVSRAFSCYWFPSSTILANLNSNFFNCFGLLFIFV
jgi:hypothetical protein